jgi:hypothetical protein
MDQLIEEAAKRIYYLLPWDRSQLRTTPPWVEGGNSIMQDNARVYARVALEGNEGMILIPAKIIERLTQGPPAMGVSVTAFTIDELRNLYVKQGGTYGVY